MKIKRWTTKTDYAELDQPNPLRWQIYFQDSDNVLVPQTGKLRCRDFFNDLVARKREVHFYIYGLDNQTVSLNDEFIWIRLWNVRDSLVVNMEKWLKAVFEDFSKQEVIFVKQTPTSYFVRLPAVFLEKTYYISLATLLIRLSNYNKVYESQDECISNIPVFEGHVYANRITQKLRKYGFNLPDTFKDVWWWSNSSYYSSSPHPVQDYQLSSMVHNSGVAAYLKDMD